MLVLDPVEKLATDPVADPTEPGDSANAPTSDSSAGSQVSTSAELADTGELLGAGALAAGVSLLLAVVPVLRSVTYRHFVFMNEFIKNSLLPL